MNFDVEERKQQLEVFSGFINESYNRIDEMLLSVGWTREYLTNENTDTVSCPLNSEHRVPKKSLDSHVQLCSWRREGYHEQDTPLPENSIENYEKTKSSIVIDAQLQALIIKDSKEQDSSLQSGNLEADKCLVPKTSERLTADFTPDERRILYDYVISKTTPVEDVKVEELQLIGDMKKDEQPRPKSKLELLIEQRDAKRRRISYKKKVHTNRKSHTEILHEVIQNQMELLEQIIKGECDDEIGVDDKDEIFSLGGDEINILSSKSRSQNKSKHEIGEAADICSRGRNFDRKVTEKDTGIYESENSYDAPDDVGKRYNRSEQPYKNWPGKSQTYRKYEKDSYERKRWGERLASSSSSFEDRTSRDRYRMNDYKDWERSRDYRSYDRDKNDHYHQSRVNSEELEEYANFRQPKYYSKHDRSESRKEYYSHSKHSKHTSKRDSSEVDMDLGKECESHSKRLKYSSKYASPEHDREHERKYEMRNSHKNYTDTSKRDDFSDKYSDCSDMQSKESHRQDNYDNCKNGREFDEWSVDHKEVKIKVEKDEMSPESRKCSKKLKKSKKKKKKHKHKTKKKHKRKRSSSSCSNSLSQSSSEGSDIDSS